MNTLSAIDRSTDQARANKLADDLQNREFIARDPALQKPWAIAQHHPMVREYAAAKLKVELSLPPRAGSFVDDSALDRIAAKRDAEGLRRAVDLACRIERRKRDQILAKKKTRPNETGFLFSFRKQLASQSDL